MTTSKSKSKSRVSKPTPRLMENKRISTFSSEPFSSRYHGSSIDGRFRNWSVRDELSGLPLGGFAQAIAANSLLNQIIWCLLFSTSCGFLVWNLIYLYDQFKEKPFNPEVKVDGAKFVFPDFYICHSILPSVSVMRYYLDKELRNVNDLIARIKDLKKTAKKVETDFKKKYPKQLEDVKNHWFGLNKRLSTTIILSSFTDEKNPLKLFSNPREQTIISAFLNERHLTLNDFKIVPHREFFSCLKFLNSSLLKSKQDKLNLYLYLDESQPFNLQDSLMDLLDISYKGFRVDDKSEGIELIFVGTNKDPGNWELALNAAPGTITRVRHLKISCPLSLI